MNLLLEFIFSNLLEKLFYKSEIRFWVLHRGGSSLQASCGSSRSRRSSMEDVMKE
jgi:hypothetical protein